MTISEIKHFIRFSRCFIGSLLCCVLLLIACNEQENTAILPDNLTLSEKIQRATDDEYLHALGLTKTEQEFLQNCYQKNQFKPLWINDSTFTPLGKRVHSVLRKSIHLGIPENRLRSFKSSNAVEEDLLTTLQLAYLFHDLDSGFINFEKGCYKPMVLVTPAVFEKRIKYDEHEDLRRQLLYRTAADSNYIILAGSLLRFIDSHPLDTTSYDIPGLKTDTVKTLSLTSKALVSKGYLPSGVNYTDSVQFFTALKAFQEDNELKPDGVIGKYTAKYLNESTYDKVLRISIALDKARQQKVYPAKYIRINIPSFELNFFAQDTLRSQHKIIVGTPDNPTPVLNAFVRKIVVYPYWKVPYSIASKEILPAVKRDRNYLHRNNYKIYRKDVEVNPHNVRWSRIKENSFPYTVIQQPGPKNSLGILKFDFHNNYSVYFHDTPSKGLFGADVRAFSHGCMRTEKPVDLAKAILFYDSVPRRRNDLTADSLDSLLGLEENYEIRLVDKIPVFIEYTTVSVNKGEMRIFGDLYGREAKYITLMKAKNPRIE